MNYPVKPLSSIHFPTPFHILASFVRPFANYHRAIPRKTPMETTQMSKKLYSDAIHLSAVAGLTALTSILSDPLFMAGQDVDAIVIVKVGK